jgi:5-methyltetrahydropteroyltriglutamate--homocysteine methyltransferase
MKRSTDRILTTHAGSLPRPPDLIDLYRNDAADAELLPRLCSAVGDAVQQQLEAGVDVINDGEFGKASRAAVDYGAWWSYVYARMEGFEVRNDDPSARGYGPHNSKDRRVFKEFYDTGAPMSAGQSGGGTQNTATARLAQLVCTGPVKYTGHALVQRDIDNFKHALSQVEGSALDGVKVEEAFLPAVSPATLQIISNAHYGSMEDYTWALAEAIREEYRAIVDSGFILQIDDPALVDLYDWWFSATDDLAGFRKWAAFQVEAVNHALEGIPEDRIRFHICWGSWHGPHSTDVPLKEVADLLIQVKAQAYSIEAGNVRHEHEWKVWRDTVKLPEGRVLIPGVVSHATNVLEHPELVADRIVQYADLVGRENVIAGTDCGLGGRIHPQLVWAKLRVLAEGAALASKQLWG